MLSHTARICTLAGRMRRRFPAPKSVVVVGAGVVGLSCAIFLRLAGMEVTVVEAEEIASGASWGNAGWLSPALSTPLPEQGMLGEGMRAILTKDSPVYVPKRIDPALFAFLGGLALRSNNRAWRRSMTGYVRVNASALSAFDDLAAVGVQEPTKVENHFVVAFTDLKKLQVMRQQLLMGETVGQATVVEDLDVGLARDLVPALSTEVKGALRLGAMRYVDPPKYLEEMGRVAKAMGVELRTQTTVVGVDGGSPLRRASVQVSQSLKRTQGLLYGQSRLAPGGPLPRRRGLRVEKVSERVDADVVVLANGAWLGELARPFGVRTQVRAGRGYSFSVGGEQVPSVPIWIPEKRLVGTPLDGRLRLSAMMEFRKPGDAADLRRIDMMVTAAQSMLSGIDFQDRSDEWVGSRAITPDGRPLIGSTRSPRVLTAGGHGMWGLTLGPTTGQLISELVVTGIPPSQLQPFDPLR